MGGKSDAPAPPDYRGAAQEQAAASKEVTNIQNFANRPTQVTPFGTTSWSTAATTDPATGQPVTSWTQRTSLAPELQNALDSQLALQQGRSDLAQGFMGRVANEYSKPFDWNNLPQMQGAGGPGRLQSGFNFGSDIPQIDSGFRDKVAGQLMEKMQPVHDYQTRGMETKLANQGLRPGSEAYNRAMGQLGQQQAAERYNALDASGNEAQRLFGMQMQSAQQGYNQNLGAAQFGNQAATQQQALNQQAAQFQNQLRQQAIAEQMQRRGMSLNEMNALLSGQQVAMPQMPGFNQAQRSEAPNLLGATQMGYDAQLGAVNANNAASSSMFGGLTSLANTGMMGAFMFSDRRLKSNIKRVGTHAIGVGIYEYTMMGMPQRGVIAQEVQAVRPDLVERHANGFLMVNYGGL